MSVQIEIIEADITTLDVDAIVNAANEQLRRGGGVCGAIHRAAGLGLERDCRALGGCPTGEARITKGHDLKARHVIHAVGPVWYGGDENEATLLAGCYDHCFQLADQAGLSSIAFPAISTGIFGYPLAAATEIAMGAAKSYRANSGSLNRIVFCCFGANVAETYAKAANQA
ncbi:MAG: macro domain-containing protein [Alphaproteobacteria bacterium]|nr:macro domain-containing protein [Alphaproteobacteria bacterium]